MLNILNFFSIVTYVSTNRLIQTLRQSFVFERSALIFVTLLAVSSCSFIENKSGYDDNHVSNSGIDMTPSNYQEDSRDVEPKKKSSYVIKEENSSVDEKIADVFPEPGSTGSSEKYFISFERAPLEEVVHAILSDLLSMSYVVDTPIKGTVTFHSKEKILRKELLAVLEVLLKSNGYSVSSLPSKTLVIHEKDKGDAHYISTKSNSQIGRYLQVIPLKYISAEQASQILSPMLDNNIQYVASHGQLLVVEGTSSDFNSILEILSIFDVDRFAGKSVGIFPIQNSPATTVHDELRFLVSSAEEYYEGEAGLYGYAQSMVIDRLNAILVVSHNSENLASISEWISRLDQEGTSSNSVRLRTYNVQHASATRLVDLVNQLLPYPDEGQAGSAHTYRIAGDEHSNAVMIHSSLADYKMIISSLAELDIPPTRISVKADIIEVALTDGLQYGVEWYFNNSLGSRYSGSGELSDINVRQNPISGFSYTVLNSTEEVSAVLNALESESAINLRSSPNLMILDGGSGSISVGTQVPIPVTTIETGDGFNERVAYEYRDTGVTLEVTAHANAGGLVTMEIQQSTTDIGPTVQLSDSTRASTFFERDLRTKVNIRDGESLVVGGLISENVSSDTSGVPLLFNAPIIGPLFGGTSENGRRVELIVVISPSVIFNDEEAEIISQELKKVLSQMVFIEG